MKIFKKWKKTVVSLFDKTIKMTSFWCHCGNNLRVNNRDQVVFYCSRRCRKMRHNTRGFYGTEKKELA